MEFGICVASHIGDTDYLVRAETLGYTHAWLADSQMLWSDCYATLALAGVTETLTVKGDITTAGLTSPTVGANYDAREINQLFRQPHLTSLEETDVVDFVQKVTRLAALHNAILIRVAFENVTHTLLVDHNATRLRCAFEDLRERSRCGRLDPRAITHASQERFVNEVSFFEVR